MRSGRVMNHLLLDDTPPGPPHREATPDLGLNGRTGGETGMYFTFTSLFVVPQPTPTNAHDERHPDAPPNG